MDKGVHMDFILTKIHQTVTIQVKPDHGMFE